MPRASGSRASVRRGSRSGRFVCADSGSDMSGGGERRASTCRVELGALLAPEPRPPDNKVKVRTECTQQLFSTLC